jgi:hypothetical protein
MFARTFDLNCPHLILPRSTGNDVAGFGVGGVQWRNPELLRQKCIELLNVEINQAQRIDNQRMPDKVFQNSSKELLPPSV